MKFEEHCEESIMLFENAFAQAHQWLDELACKPAIGMKHRRFRHHEAGIKQIEAMWGNEAALAATTEMKSMTRKQKAGIIPPFDLP